jgi:Tfp pilus assembly protein PilX
MKTTFNIQKRNPAGSALMLTLIMSAIALALLGSVMSWSVSNTRLTYRSIQYNRSVAAAEAATEKVVGQINRDFLYGGESLVVNSLNTYRQNTVPTSSDSSYWGTWEFNDANGNIGQTYVERTPGTSYIVLDSTYAGLKATASIYTIVSHARDNAGSQDVTGGVLQQLQLASIPIFQFAMYSSGEMEIGCGKPFDVTGRVHSNGKLYVEPDNALTFESSVTAVTDILDKQRDPLDTRGTPAGSMVYVHLDQKKSPDSALTLPIGTTNTPEAIREIIEPPPTGEDPDSPIGRLRYYNQCDMVVVVSNNWVVGATSGHFDGFKTPIPTNELALFVSTANSFWDAREGKTVRPIDIDIGALKSWSETNSSLRPTLFGSNLTSVYVVDGRTLPGNSLGAVRVFNGVQLPTNGLTVATGRPLYVWKDYNQQNTANLGTADTSTTRPASLVGDAITVLSDAWQDGNSASMQGALPTTVNAAFLAGTVETTQGQYSGGMENFPRFLEAWGTANVFTYNGSMVKMFPSLYATNVWSGIHYSNHYYDPPKRNWAYDANFDDPTKLPPKTPSLLKVIRSQWANVAPDQNVAP